MLTLLASLLGFLSSAVPQVISFFSKKKEFEHEIKLIDKQIELMDASTRNNVKIEEVRAHSAESVALYKHDASIKTNSGFINAVRASIRPVITYFFFGLFLTIKGVSFYHAVKYNYLDSVHNVEYVDINSLLNVIWDQDTKSLFAAIMGFWFGSRTIEKLRK